MDQTRSTRMIFELFESSGIGIVGLDEQGRIAEVNRNVGVYLGLDQTGIVGHEATILRPAIRSDEFWKAFPATFYCLAPGPECLLLIVSRPLRPVRDEHLSRAIILRPYSLEREFARMRVRLSSYLAHEVAARLNSIGMAGEFITEPELRESLSTREAFMETFRHDLVGLNELFVQLLETAEHIPLPSHVVRTPVDWRALVTDLVGKIRGLASESSVGLCCELPPHLPTPRGDYHWLYLGLFGILSHALQAAPPLTEVTLTVRGDADRLETIITVVHRERNTAATWPPRSLFTLDEDHPRIQRFAIEESAITRAIFLLHGGEILATDTGESREYTVVLPV